MTTTSPAPAEASTDRSRTRWFVLAGLLVALLLAGFASYYASSAPDGLEKVAADKGLDTGARDSATAGSPLADYSVSGVSNQRLSGGLAGVIGVGVTLALAGGIFLIVRKREPAKD
ncbi:MAG: PDGLE domain-containing protein [Candidatus Nanopelagicales bacterium]